MTAPVITVLIVDDDALMRAGLRGVLSDEPDLDVIGDAPDGRSAVHRARLLRPDVVLMDVRMPDLDGITATQQILSQTDSTRVLVLTTFEQDDYLFGALEAGAAGFVLKRTAPEELTAAVRTVAAGNSLQSPSLTNRVIARATRQPTPDADAKAKLAGLTPRELEVLWHVGRGLSNAEIAATLHIEESTVKTHVKRVLAKLQARDRVEAVLFARASALVEPRDGVTR